MARARRALVRRDGRRGIALERHRPVRGSRRDRAHARAPGRSVRAVRCSAHTFRRRASLAGARGVSAEDRGPHRGVSRPCRVHGVCQRRRLSRDQSSVHAVCRGVADWLPARGRTGKRRAAVCARASLRDGTAVGGPMAAALSTQSSAMAERVRRAAQLLLEARQSGRRLTALPDDVRPRTTEEAYAIQDSVLEQLGLVGGWKVGAKSATAEPTCAPLLATLVLRSPQQFPAGTFALNDVEAELAFTLARDLPLRDELYTEP